jgi:hypothetical protein
VSIIECISINGYTLPPFIIFEGQRIQHSCLDPSLNPETVIRVTPNGWTDHDVALKWLQHFDQHTKSQRQGQYRLLILDGHSSHQTIEFVKYCEKESIIPLCLPPHTTHILQPLDVRVFGPLAKAYKQLVSRKSIFRAQRINNYQFLLIYQKARQNISRNIQRAWKGVRLHPYNLTRILSKYQPKTPFSANATTTVTTSITTTTTTTITTTTTTTITEKDLINKVNDVAKDVLAVCPTPVRNNVTFIQQTCISSLADKQALEAINQALLEKQRNTGRKKTNKFFGMAKKLTVTNMLNQQKRRQKIEQQQLDEKARKAALRGKVGFAKLVWKEMPMGIDVFSCE